VKLTMPLINIIKKYRDVMRLFACRKRSPDNVYIDPGVKVDKTTTLESHSRLHRNVSFLGSVIGRGSYVGWESILNNVSIGRFSSVAPNVSVVYGRHPSRVFISTSPLFYSTQKQSGTSWFLRDPELFDEFKLINGWSLVIGSDVWIGSDVLILEGLNIGDGAIVAAGSVVTKDVLPFSIVAGNPAHHIRYRFEDEERSTIKDDPWWDWPYDYVRKNSYNFLNIKEFYKLSNDEIKR
jgi:acetyltransferase-like isoleucine patch superfamily enzyme